MTEKKPVLYAIKFAFVAFFACVFVLLAGYLFGTHLMNEGESTKNAISLTKSKITIVIDAGHGGEDGGAVADDLTYEKDLNLQISKLLCAIYELNGNEVRMTRENDTLLYDYFEDLDNYKGVKKIYDLKNRLKIAESYDNSIYIGIHMNKFPQEKYSGLQVYYSKNDKISKEIALSIKENNKKFLQKNNTREIKEANSSIYILDKIKIPAVLVECGFLSNKGELELLKSKDYQASLALMLFSSLAPFTSEN